MIAEPPNPDKNTALGRSFHRRWQRMPHWMRRVALGLIAFYLVYLVAANVFLNTSIGRDIVNQKPEKFLIQWHRAFTWWPGWVKVWNLELTGHTPRWDWSMTADRASGHIAIAPLFRREFRIPVVTADNVSGGARRNDSDTPPREWQPGGWKTRFERISSTSIRHAYWNDLQLDGLGSGTFGYYKQMRGGPLEIFPSHFEFNDARILHRGQEWARDGDFTVDLSIDRHVPAEARGIKRLTRTDLHVKLESVLSGMHIDRDDSGNFRYRSDPATGRIQADIVMHRGALQPGSALSADITIKDGDTALLNEKVELKLAVDRDITLSALSPKETDDQRYLDVVVHIAGNELPWDDWRKLLDRSSATATGHWYFPHLNWLNILFPDTPWLVLDGSGVIDFDLKAQQGHFETGSRVSVPEAQAEVDVMSYRVHGKGQADITLHSDDEKRLFSHFVMQMQAFSIAAKDAPSAIIVKGRHLDLDLRTDLKNAATDTLQGKMTFQNAQVPDLRVYNRFLPRQHMRFDGGSGALSGEVDLAPGGEVSGGWLKAQGNDAQLHMAGIALHGNVDIDARLGRTDIQAKRFVLSGSTIQLNDISFTEPGGQSRSGWWARLNLDNASANWNNALTIDSHVRMTARDVGFVLSMFSSQHDYPNWIIRLIDAGKVEATGRARWHGDDLILDHVEAANDRFEVAAKLRLQNNRRQGALYAKWGILSTAVEVNDAQRQFHWRKSKAWYDAQPNFLH